MYIESKANGLTGSGRIGRVTFSKTGRTLYHCGRKFRPLKGRDLTANYVDVETRCSYWISGCRRDGNDPLYGGVVDVDDDVRVEYWTEIRQCPEL